MAANLDRAETSLTAVSDVAYLRGVDSNGNSVRISKADLASVLGVNDFLVKDTLTSEAIDNVPLDGIAKLYSFGSTDITGGLGLHYGIILDCSNNYRRFQVLVASDGAAIRGGDSSGWYSWFRIDRQQ